MQIYYGVDYRLEYLSADAPIEDKDETSDYSDADGKFPLFRNRAASTTTGRELRIEFRRNWFFFDWHEESLTGDNSAELT
jgi:hypothetical protein